MSDNVKPISVARADDCICGHSVWAHEIREEDPEDNGFCGYCDCYEYEPQNELAEG